MGTNPVGNPNVVSPFNNDFDQDVVQLMGHTAPDGSSFGKFTLTPASDTRQKELLCDVRPIIPVIFIPGVMGTLLVNKNTGDEMFFPPNADTMSRGGVKEPGMGGVMAPAEPGVKRGFERFQGCGFLPFLATAF
ncbi:hypothetical protein LGM32_32885, partial [Burkholderia vietnamiensis]|nr:hypothetical protein [Burkholderia vietnamiensis]